MVGFESGPNKQRMPSAESLPSSPNPEDEHELVKDYLFDQYLKQQLVEDFFEDLGDYLSDEEVDAMRGELALWGDEEAYAALSLPRELRPRRFSMFRAGIEQGQQPADLMRDFVQASVKRGFGVGYHTSPHDIKQDANGSWSVKGRENDHRDSDLSRAYYSTKYRHLFKKKDPKFIYIVRTDPETHRTDGNWSRAGALSVVMRVPFGDVVDYVERVSRDIEKQKTADAGEASAG